MQLNDQFFNTLKDSLLAVRSVIDDRAGGIKLADLYQTQDEKSEVIDNARDIVKEEHEIWRAKYDRHLARLEAAGFSPTVGSEGTLYCDENEFTADLVSISKVSDDGMKVLVILSETVENKFGDMKPIRIGTTELWFKLNKKLKWVCKDGGEHYCLEFHAVPSTGVTLELEGDVGKGHSYGLPPGVSFKPCSAGGPALEPAPQSISPCSICGDNGDGSFFADSEGKLYCEKCWNGILSAPYVDVGPVTIGTQNANACASCGEIKDTPLRRDEMGGYVCLACVDKRLDLYQSYHDAIKKIQYAAMYGYNSTVQEIVESLLGKAPE